jgi:hypothetical protein
MVNLFEVLWKTGRGRSEMVRSTIIKFKKMGLAVLLAGTMLLASCGVSAGTEHETETVSSALAAVPVSAVFDDSDTDAGWNETATFLTLCGDSVSVTGSGAEADGAAITITAAGTYVLSGILNNGRIVVNTKDAGAVRLVLNDADITSRAGTPVYVKSAEKTVLVLAEGTENSVTDEADASGIGEATGIPDAAIRSESDLTINGEGALFVTAEKKGGIVSRDALKIMSGTLSLHTAGDGLCAGQTVIVTAGTLRLASGKVGIHSDGTVDISGGEIDIQQSFEGIKGARVAVSDGLIRVVSEGDGINVAAGNESPKEDGKSDSDDSRAQADGTLEIAGGFLTVDASGGGVDVYGAAYMTGGTVIINGPADNAGDALHYTGEFQIIGGYLLVADSSGMAQSPPNDSSAQYTVTVTYDEVQSRKPFGAFGIRPENACLPLRLRRSTGRL